MLVYTSMECQEEELDCIRKRSYDLAALGLLHFLSSCLKILRSRDDLEKPRE